jgi:large subunit ribosomal protein L22
VTGPKLNEAPVRRPGAPRTPHGAPRGTRAVARYARVSPYKVRVVLDLIRGKDVGRAAEILKFCERDAAALVGKVLGSAVANADSNDSILAEDLYVSACFADEGPTLKRWRPRARGRATRIRKRTCHVTVIVSRLPDDELQRRRREGAAGDRARRRAGQERATRRRGAAPDAEEAVEETTPVVDEAPVEEAVVEEAVVDEAPVEEAAVEEPVVEEAVPEAPAPADEQPEQEEESSS